MYKQGAEKGLVISAQGGAEGRDGGGLKVRRKRKIKKTKAPYLEGWLLCFNKPLVCCDFIQLNLE